MKPHHPSPAKPKRHKGFALVVTLTLMILLTIIAVGLLSLSEIALRSSSQAQAATTARNNARLALMVALGELQKSLGTDQSVSAPASAVFQNAQRPHLTGAWESWRWTPSTSGGPSYSEKSGKFRRWLISSEDQEDAESLSYANTSPKKATDPNSVVLVGAVRGAQGVTTEVIADKVPVEKSSLPGKMAWAVFDESTKAAINLEDTTNSTDPNLEVASRTAPDRLRVDPLNEGLSALKDAKNLVSLETAAIPVGSANTSEIRQRFHDFTTGTVGLLTDTARGGFKQDLTTLFEAQALPTDAFDRDTPYPQGFDTEDGAPSWAYIRDHYRKYKNLTLNDGVPTYSLVTNSAQGTDLQVDLDGAETGVNPDPETERLLPVLARFQLVFSYVAHEIANAWGRHAIFNDHGDPKGVGNYALVMLTMDPVVTLYNPYDVALDLSKLRIRVWDPPALVRFTKIDKKDNTESRFRTDGQDGFVPIGQLQAGGTNPPNDQNPNARKVFTLLLADGEGNRIEPHLKLMPGEVKVFAPRVETAWTWGLENINVMDQKNGACFWDWNPERNFSSLDNRDSALHDGKFGLECVPGWDNRAGLTVDHLVAHGFRNMDSLYKFQKDPSNPQRIRSGYNIDPQLINMRKTDEIRGELKPARAAGKATTDFQLDILAGLKPGNTANPNLFQDPSNLAVIEDTLRSFRFNFGNDPTEELAQNAKNPVITRQFQVGDLLQSDADKTAGGKTPFAMLEMIARVTKDRKTDTKPWLYNNFVVEGGKTDTGTVGLANQAYDVRIVGVTSLKSSDLGGIEIDPATYRGYFGPAATAQEGCSIVNMYRIPLAPAASLGDLVHSNLVATSQLPRVVHAFGNSRAHPLIPAGNVSSRRGSLLMDHSYLLNDALWDSYYFSSITEYSKGVMPQSRSMQEVLSGVLNGTQPAINSRLVPVRNPGDTQSLAGEVSQLDAAERSRQLGRHLGISGPFNVNSTSVDAWRAVLSSLRDRQVNGLKFDASGNSLRNAAYDNPNETPLVRAGKPVAGPDAADHLRWAGFSTLEDEQIENLAESIVEQIASRGQKDGAPALTLAEFVNRRPGGDNVDSLAGILQTAIDNSNINDAAHRQDSIPIDVASIPTRRKQGAPNTEAMGGKSAEGAPTMVTQGDLMAALAPIATVRGDTFKIRSYGEATAADGKTVLARAWCEAVVQRMPDYVDSMDEPDTDVDALTSEANKTFGRRFEIVSFRWLTEEEL